VEPKKDVASNARPRSTRLVDLAHYQKDSIVSQTIIDRKNGTVTFFAFDKGQRLSEHIAPYDALVHVLEGEARIVISGKTFALEEGSFIVIPAKEPHSITAVKKFKMMLTMIRS
jgi:quercetin dioxygenase-like cupin family protein